MLGAISNPPTPYVGSVSLQDGSRINIQGVPEHHQTQFVIALQSGSNINQRSEIPFWFNPRFNENQVVRNTLSGGSWGPEERHGGFPFQQGQIFNVEILVKSKKYEVTVNGQHFGKYKHRTPISAVTHLVVEGGTKIHQIHFENPSHFPGVVGGFPPPPGPMMYTVSPIFNPPTPYVGSVSLQDGSRINIQGVPEHHQTQFVIALQSGSNINQRSEIPFWFNPRFNENQVVRNTLSGGSWGPEERHGGFPFQQGQIFNVEILVKSKKYEVTVNGQHFGKYKHRTPISAVTHLVVEGGTKIHQIHFENPSHFPGVVGGFPPPPGPMMYTVAPIFNPPTPFVQNIPGGIYPGKMIFISGVPSPNPTRFSIYLQNGVTYEPGHIGLVVDARFSFNSDRNVLVRNHRERGSWGREEREVSHFPFIPNAPFDMIILIEDHQYKVAVNNQHLLEFHHRIKPLSSIDTLRIDGSVVLTQIRFQ